MDEQKQKPLFQATWANLLKLTGENMSDQQLSAALKTLNVDRLDQLSQQQAELLIETLKSLPYLKSLLWSALVDAIESEQSKPGRRMLAKVDAPVVADLIVPMQVDKLAMMLIRQSQTTLASHNDGSVV